MTEETKPKNEEIQQSENTVTEKVKKLLIDKPSDFKFHAAYIAYSGLWDKMESSNTKKELNNIITSLSKDELSYSKFYRALDDYRRLGSRRFEFKRDRIETQRKRDWRQKQTRSQRNQRHKGRR